MKKALAAVATLALALGGCSGSGSNETGTSESNPLSALQMNLTLPDGAQLNAVTYTVSGGGLASNRNGSVNVENSTVLRFRVGNLPIANGYTMALGGTTVGGKSCAGSAGFNIANNQVTTMTMTLTCGTGVTYEVDNNGDVSVDVEVRNESGAVCPVVTGISALPLEVLVGSSLQLEGFSTSAPGASSWTGTGGSFASASAAATSFTCGTAGDHTLTFGITKPECDPSSQTVVVTCTASDASVPDSGVPDTSVPDTSVPDTSVPDTSVPVKPSLSAACVECTTGATSVCRTFQDVGVDFPATCLENPDPAFDQKCTDAYNCSMAATDNCIADVTRGAISCYCGPTTSLDDCFSTAAGLGPKGLCQGPWEVASGCDTAPVPAACVSNNFGATTQPSAYAAFLIACAATDCSASCL